MARTMAGLPAGTRVSDYIGLGVVTMTFPRGRVQLIAVARNRLAQRERLAAVDGDDVGQLAFEEPEVMAQGVSTALLLEVRPEEVDQGVARGGASGGGVEALPHRGYRSGCGSQSASRSVE